MKKVGPVILAQHRGRCPECGDPIRTDDPIRLVEDLATGSEVYLHEECVVEEPGGES